MSKLGDFLGSIGGNLGSAVNRSSSDASPSGISEITAISQSMTSQFSSMMSTTASSGDPFIYRNLTPIDGSNLSMAIKSITTNMLMLDSKVRMLDKNIRNTTKMIDYNRKLAERTNSLLNASSVEKNYGRYKKTENDFESAYLDSLIEKRLAAMGIESNTDKKSGIGSDHGTGSIGGLIGPGLIGGSMLAGGLAKFGNAAKITAAELPNIAKLLGRIGLPIAAASGLAWLLATPEGNATLMGGVKGLKQVGRSLDAQAKRWDGINGMDNRLTKEDRDFLTNPTIRNNTKRSITERYQDQLNDNIQARNRQEMLDNARKFFGNLGSGAAAGIDKFFGQPVSPDRTGTRAFSGAVGTSTSDAWGYNSSYVETRNKDDDTSKWPLFPFGQKGIGPYKPPRFNPMRAQKGPGINSPAGDWLNLLHGKYPSPYAPSKPWSANSNSAAVNDLGAAPEDIYPIGTIGSSYSHPAPILGTDLSYTHAPGQNGQDPGATDAQNKGRASWYKTRGRTRRPAPFGTTIATTAMLGNDIGSLFDGGGREDLTGMDEQQRSVAKEKIALKNYVDNFNKYSITAKDMVMESYTFKHHTTDKAEISSDGPFVISSKQKLTLVAPNIQLVGALSFMDLNTYNASSGNAPGTVVPSTMPGSSMSGPSAPGSSQSQSTPVSVGGYAAPQTGSIPRVGMSGAPVTGAPSTTVPTGKSDVGGRAAQAMRYFKSQGWSDVAASGIVANLMAESGSGMNNSIYGGGSEARGMPSEAYGLAQWHPDRQANFARVFGKSIKDSTFEEQLAFVQWELNNTHRSAGEAIRSATTPEQAAFWADRKFEGSAGLSTGTRMQTAANLYGNRDKFAAADNQSSATSSSVGTANGSTSSVSSKPVPLAPLLTSASNLPPIDMPVPKPKGTLDDLKKLYATGAPNHPFTEAEWKIFRDLSAADSGEFTRWSMQNDTASNVKPSNIAKPDPASTDVAPKKPATTTAANAGWGDMSHTKKPADTYVPNTHDGVNMSASHLANYAESSIA